MNIREDYPSICEPSLRLLGDYWTLRIIDALQTGELRFCELQRSLGNLNPVTLTNRLKKLEDAQLINRTEDTPDKVSVTYSLTTLGTEVLPVIDAVNVFSVKAKNVQAGV
jgi:DNA-binding HxlR family transcriptional regulator